VHYTTDELTAGLEEIRRSPTDHGTVEMIVRRPTTGEREVLDLGRLDPESGLLGDNWKVRGSRLTDDGLAHPGMQINMMNARAVARIAGPRERWPLAGDQLYVDLALGDATLPAGTRLTLGSAVIEITAEPHNGCARFTRRFGLDAMRFVNSAVGKELRLRGVNARVVTAGEVRPGDTISKIPST
jgi:MOSC domain